MVNMQTDGANSAALLNTVESFALLLANSSDGTEKVIKKDNIGVYTYV